MPTPADTLAKIFENAPLPLTSAQVKEAVGTTDMDRLGGEEKVHRGRLLNIYAFAETPDAFEEKRARLMGFVEDSAMQDPVIEEFHLIGRSQNRLQESYDLVEIPRSLVKAAVHELVARGSLFEIQKFPMPIPPSSFYCHTSYWSRLEAVIGQCVKLLSKEESLSIADIGTVAKAKFGKGSEIREAVTAIRSVLLYWGVADLSKTGLVLPGSIHEG